MPNQRQAERGSAILAVMIFASIMAVLAAYFIRHASTESMLATRTFYQSAATNLAEAGIDEAMLDINNANIGPATGWRAATDNSASWVKIINGNGDANYQLGSGTGNILVRIDNWTANTTAIVTVTAVGQVTFQGAAAANRQLVVKVAKRAAQGAGLLAKGGITFNGNIAIDSYNSQLGVPNTTTNRTDQVIVATTSATATVAIGGNALVYGFVATGGAQPTVGPNGRIYGASTQTGVKIDPTRVRSDFIENIPNPSAPTGTPINLGAITSNVTLPRVGDLPQANGRYLYTDDNGGVQLGGSATLTINGPVDLIVVNNLQTSSHGKILVTDSGGAPPTMKIYAYGEVQIGGDGVSNATNIPANAYVYAMGSPAVQLNGNADFTGVIYAPNSTLQLNGNGNINGALVGNSVQFNGNAQLHYDVQLGGSAASPYYAVKSWVELTNGSSSGGPFARDQRDPFTFF